MRINTLHVSHKIRPPMGKISVGEAEKIATKKFFALN